jgi:hypothetical protein
MEKRVGARQVLVVVSLFLGLLLPAITSAQQYILPFDLTPRLADNPPLNGGRPAIQLGAATGMLTIQVDHPGLPNVQSHLHFAVRGVRPNTIYTIWTVFGSLTMPMQFPIDPSTGLISAKPALSMPPRWVGQDGTALPYYLEGGAVAPTASVNAAFTNGMGLDPGLSFVTDNNGNADADINLDYNILGVTYYDGPPVANKHIITQCVDASQPGPPVACGPSGQTQSVTSTWLRWYIGQSNDPGAHCGNYDPNAEFHSAYWECIDPNTRRGNAGNGVPRVWRYPWDHFRLAAHPDDLTHGFIGGNGDEHIIDMVGRRSCLIQSNGQPVPSSLMPGPGSSSSSPLPCPPVSH